MSFSKEIILDLHDADGEVKVMYSPMSFAIYQNGEKVKRQGRGLKPKFNIKMKSGELELIIVSNTKGMVRTIFFKDQQIPLEEKATVLDKLIGIGLFLVVFVTGCVLFAFINGVLGGALLGGLVGVGVMFSLALVRKEKNILRKVLITLAVSVAVYIIYFIVGMFIVSLLHGGIMPRF